MTGKDFVNVKSKDRFKLSYKLSKGEIIFAFFCGFFLIFIWMLEIATQAG